MWYQSLIAKLEGQQVINDSKTPSGQIHVGSLRGVLIHDALYRSLRAHSMEATYLYGIDDYDPMDGLPTDADEALRQHMGKPLCNVPVPVGSQSNNIADHYIVDFLDIFQELGVDAQIYRTSELYRDGSFNTAIETILGNAATVRQIYKEVSGSHKPDNWYPFQVICESCGKIGTTRVYDYSDGLVSYQCLPDMVSWAQGCSHQGRISPLDGSGKLPWKLEWVAKWAMMGITIEGAGKDHCTKGGARDVAVRCLQQIFRTKPPLNIAYEFFLVGGEKMSSSKGVGTSAREMADFLPPALLRFLMIRTPPKRTVNFSTDYEYIVKLFNEYDQLMVKDSSSSDDLASMQTMVQPAHPSYWQPVGFQLILALLQLPNKDIVGQILSRYSLTQEQKQDLDQRIKAASYWLKHFAKERDRVILQEHLPTSAHKLADSQKAFLSVLANYLPEARKDDDYYQQMIFDIARIIPIESKQAFAAIYSVLLDKTQGPKGGSLLAYIDRAFLQKRFTHLEPDIEQFFKTTNLAGGQLINWLCKNQPHVAAIQSTKIDYQQNSMTQLRVDLDNGRMHVLRTADSSEVVNWLQQQEIQVTKQPGLTVKDWHENWQQLANMA